MNTNIKIKILDYDDFDRLPREVTRGADVSQSIGFADTERKSIYVRDTGVDLLNQYLVGHELEHIFEAEGTDVDSEVPVIRHKLFSALAPMISSLGGAVGTGAKAVGSGLLSGAGKVGAGALSAVKGAGSFVGGAGKSLMSSFQPAISSASKAFVPAALGAKVGSGFNVGMGGLANQQLAAQGVNKTPGSLLSMFGNPSKSQLLGAGLLGAGLLKKPPQVQPLPSSVPQLQQQIQGGGSEVGKLGRQALTTQLGQQFDPMSQPEIQASLRQLELEESKAMDQVRDLYRNLRPGSDPSSDSLFRRDIQEITDQFARAKSDTIASRTRELKANFDAQRTQQIQLAIGASDSEMQQLAQLAQLDVDQIAQQLQIDLAQAQQFKNTFIDIGSTLISPETAVLNKLFPGLA